MEMIVPSSKQKGPKTRKPLAPLLYNLVGDVLTRMLTKVVEKKT
jgi:hypothetical protein